MVSGDPRWRSRCWSHPEPAHICISGPSIKLSSATLSEWITLFLLDPNWYSCPHLGQGFKITEGHEQMLKTTTTWPGSGKLLTAKHVVRQRPSPTSPRPLHLWGLSLWSLLAAPKSAVPRSASRGHLVGLHLRSWLPVGLRSGGHTQPTQAAPGGPQVRVTTGEGRSTRAHCAWCFPGYGVTTTWWPYDGFQPCFSLLLRINKLHKVHKTLCRWIHFYTV